MVGWFSKIVVFSVHPDLLRNPKVDYETPPKFGIVEHASANSDRNLRASKFSNPGEGV